MSTATAVAPDERYHALALDHIAQARDAAMRLAGMTQDWTAKGLLEIEFRELERTVREFGRCQFGIGLSSHRKA